MGGHCAQCGASDEKLKLLRCSRCKAARYCSAECQTAHYPIHKGPCKAAASGKQIIYYFTTNDDEDLWALACCKCLLAQLKTKFHVQPVKDHSTAVRILNEQSTKIVLAVTPWVSKTKANLPLKEYIERGGTLFCCGQFSNIIRPLDANNFFSKMGFSWKFGSYCRTDDHVTPTAAARFPCLPEMYSNKATRLANVHPKDRIYAPTSDSRVQSMVFSAEPVKTDEASAALGNCGKGYFGYIGDVNDEEASAIAVTSICEELMK